MIVASILMAFGIERWWDGRQEADAEADYLQRVSADLDANVRIFQQQLLDWETSARAAAALLGLLEGTTHRPTDSGLAIAVARLGSVNNAPPRDGTFRDLETTGNLRLITDAELRSAVVTYFSQDLRAGRPAFDDRQDHRLRLFARENLPAEVTFNVFNLCPQETPAFTCDFADPPPMDRVWQRLADDPAMPDLLRSRQADLLAGLRTLGIWLDRTEEIQGLLLQARDE